MYIIKLDNLYNIYIYTYSSRVGIVIVYTIARTIEHT